MKKVIIFSMIVFAAYACGGSGEQKEGSENNSEAAKSSGNPEYDPNRGEGRFTNVEVGEHLDAVMASEGKKVYDVKCAACHKLNEERLVGPGWEGVSKRHRPEWIMNFITNPDEMISKDPKLQAQLEICLVRMPNQNLTDDDARHVLEFMRQNDGVQ
jgi:mono/diheme cytochrome c family protein